MREERSPLLLLWVSRHIRLVVLSIALVFSGLLGTMTVLAQEDEPTVAELQAQIEQLQEENEKLRSDATKLRKERSQLRKDVENLETRVAELEEEVAGLEVQLGAVVTPTPESGCATQEEAAFIAEITELQSRVARTFTSITDITGDPSWVTDADQFLALIDLLEQFHDYYAEGLALTPPTPRLQVVYDQVLEHLAHMDQAATLIVDGVIKDEVSLIQDALTEIELAADSIEQAETTWESLGPELCFR